MREEIQCEKTVRRERSTYWELKAGQCGQGLVNKKEDGMEGTQMRQARSRSGWSGRLAEGLGTFF